MGCPHSKQRGGNAIVHGDPTSGSSASQSNTEKREAEVSSQPSNANPKDVLLQYNPDVNVKRNDDAVAHSGSGDATRMPAVPHESENTQNDGSMHSMNKKDRKEKAINQSWETEREFEKDLHNLSRKDLIKKLKTNAAIYRQDHTKLARAKAELEEKLKTSAEIHRQENANLAQENSELGKKLNGNSDVHQQDITKLTKANAKLEKRIKKADEMHQQEKTMLTEANAELVKRLNGNSDVHQQSITKLNKANAKLEKRIKKADEMHQQEKTMLTEANAELVKSHKREQKDSRKKIKQLVNEHERTSYGLRMTIEMKNQEITELKVANDELRTRLSAAFGAKLQDNNPNIADLSDKNRPTKLAEQYSELYDNEWTNCFEVLTQQQNIADKNAIAMLLQACVKIYKQCSTIASTELQILTKAVETFDPEADVSIIKGLKEKRKRRSPDDIQRIRKQQIEVQITEHFKETCKDKNIVTFWTRCLDICWLMVIQDPPIVMDTNTERRGDAFDSNLYRAYTNGGKYVEYIVWPAMKLTEDGSVLYKGVAQGMNAEQDISEQFVSTNDESVRKQPTTKLPIPTQSPDSTISPNGDTAPTTCVTTPDEQQASSVVDGEKKSEPKRSSATENRLKKEHSDTHAGPYSQDVSLTEIQSLRGQRNGKKKSKDDDAIGGGYPKVKGDSTKPFSRSLYCPESKTLPSQPDSKAISKGNHSRTINVTMNAAHKKM